MSRSSESIDLDEEHEIDLNLLFFGLAQLAEDMAQAGDPYAKRLDDLLLRFYRKITNNPTLGDSR